MKIKRFEQINEEAEVSNDRHDRKKMYLDLMKDVISLYEESLKKWEEDDTWDYTGELFDLNNSLIEIAQIFGKKENEVKKLAERLHKISNP